jgi:hypothetical protein
MHTTIRVIVGAVSLIIFLSGFVVILAGREYALSGLWALVLGGVGIIAVVLERGRYRSEAAERTGAHPGPGGGEDGALESRFQRTDELFIDPTSGTRMRVWVDPQTGERRYRAEAQPPSVEPANRP